MSNWKRISDEPPPNNFSRVLIRLGCNSWSSVVIATWMKQYNQWWDETPPKKIYYPYEVKYWCPIPEYDLED